MMPLTETLFRNATLVTLMPTTRFTFASGILLLVLIEVTVLAVHDRWMAPVPVEAPAALVAAEALPAWMVAPPTPTIELGPLEPVIHHAAPLAHDWMTVVALVTAYTPGVESCGDSADGRTSTNRSTDTHPYGIAADGAVLPPGSLIKVPEYMDVSFPDRAWEVDDTGGAMRQDFRKHYIVHLDLRYRTVVSAVKVGRQWMEISVDVTGWPADKRERLHIAAMNGWAMRGNGIIPK